MDKLLMPYVVIFSFDPVRACLLEPIEQFEKRHGTARPGDPRVVQLHHGIVDAPQKFNAAGVPDAVSTSYVIGYYESGDTEHVLTDEERQVMTRDLMVITDVVQKVRRDAAVMMRACADQMRGLVMSQDLCATDDKGWRLAMEAYFCTIHRVHQEPEATRKMLYNLGEVLGFDVKHWDTAGMDDEDVLRLVKSLGERVGKLSSL